MLLRHTGNIAANLGSHPAVITKYFTRINRKIFVSIFDDEESILLFVCNVMISKLSLHSPLYDCSLDYKRPVPGGKLCSDWMTQQSPD